MKNERYAKIITVVAAALLIFSVVMVVLYIRLNARYKDAEEGYYILQQGVEDMRAEKATADDYKTNFDTFCDEILSASITAGEVCHFTSEIWYDAIFEKNSPDTKAYVVVDREYSFRTQYRGFNGAIAKYHESDEYLSVAKEIIKDQARLKESVRSLQNPPDGYSSAYENAINAYTSYTMLSDLALSPSGSYESYTKATADYIGSISQSISRVEAVKP